MSGFLDGEGCFYANFSNSKLLQRLSKNLNNESLEYNRAIETFSLSKPKLNQKMTLTQACSGNSFKILDEVRCLCDGTRIYRFKNKASEKTYVRVEFGSLKSQQIIINYLMKYKLRTVKHVSFKRWWRVFLYRKKKLHLNPINIKKLYRLVQSINIY